MGSVKLNAETKLVISLYTDTLNFTDTSISGPVWQVLISPWFLCETEMLEEKRGVGNENAELSDILLDIKTF